MKRRDFLSLGIPATGAIMLAPGLFGASARAEINRQFTGSTDFETYDLIINGGGLSGYFAAQAASKAGKRVLLVERRPALGFDLTAKSRFYLQQKGLEKFSPELKQLFAPEGEKLEVHNPKVSPESTLGDELVMMAGSVKKGLLRNMLVSKIDVLLMTDICGLFAENGRVTGVMLATKQGTYAVRCQNFLDASDLNLISRNLADKKPAIRKASFVLEIWNVKDPVKKEIKVPADLEVAGNSITVHPGKHAEHQVFLEFGFDASGLTIDQTEHKSRRIAEKIGSQLPNLDASFNGATIQQLAWECRYELADASVPAPKLKSQYVLTTPAIASCEDILSVKNAAEKAVEKINGGSKAGNLNELYIAGKVIRKSDITLGEADEPGLKIPLMTCTFDWTKLVPGRHAYQVVVAGGGTAGSMAALGALEKGAKTVVLDYFNELGGTKTMCGVMGYYHGYQQQKYFKQQDAEANQLATAANMNKKLGRMQYLRNQTLEHNGDFFGRAILCGASRNGNTLTGALVCHDAELKLFSGDVHIDATGDGDLADFAGAAFDHGDTRAGKTQNYSQWDIRGAGKMPSNTNRDYDIINNTKVGEVQRGLFLSHYEAHFYDFHPMLAVRESRRIKGVYELDLIDVVEATHFEDTLVLASSDFDPHYVGITEFTRCGFLLPHSNDVVLEVPYRCIVPEKVDGLLISGRGISQTHNALQFTRMTADLIVLGYLTGQIAADQAWKGIRARDYNVSELQKEWAALGYYPEGFFDRKPGNALTRREEIERRIRELGAGKREYLYEVIKLPKDGALPVLKTAYSGADGSGKLLLAKALAWFGDAQGTALIAAELEKLFQEEMAQGIPADYVDTYDEIRGREQNVLEGHYWRINQNIGLLAMAGNPEHNGLIANILAHTRSGGKMMTRENDYYDERIDLKLVPCHNRILNLCFYAERLPDQRYIDPFMKLLEDEYIGNFVTEDPVKSRWRVYGGDLELFIASALARSGGKRGYEILTAYLDDVHYDFKQFAIRELSQLTGKDLGYHRRKWEDYLAGLSYPRQTVKFNKGVEV